MNGNENEQKRPTSVLRRHAKAIIVIIMAAAFLLPTALVLASSSQNPSDSSGYSQNGTGSDTTITDFTKLTRDQRRQIVEGSPGANLTDDQKKEFINTGQITSGGSSPQDDTSAQTGKGNPK